MQKNQVKWTELRVGHRKIWLISDCHWNQDDVTALKRDADWQTRVRAAWKNAVGPQDIVLDLGDVIMSRPGLLDDILMPLPGIKILVRGNHDNQPVSWYLDRGYAMVVDQFTLGPETKVVHEKGERLQVANAHRIVFNHRPVENLQGAAFCVHGHLHNNPLTERYDKQLSATNELFVLEQEMGPVLLKDWLTARGRLI